MEISRRERRRAYRAVWIVTLAGLAASLLLAAAVHERERRALVRAGELAFAAAARDRLQAVKQEALLDLETVRSVRTYFRASVAVSAEEFRTFVAPILARRPAILALQWVARAAPGGSGPQGGEGRGDAAASRLRVRHAEPRTGWGPAPGSDPGADPRWRALLERAAASGGMVSGSLVTALPGKAGTIVGLLLPVYAEAGTGEARERSARPQGFVLGVLDLRRLVESALSPLSARGIDLWVEEQEDARRLYTHLSRVPVPQASAAPSRSAEVSGRRVQEPLTVGDRRWQLVAVPAPGHFLPALSRVPQFTLLGGLLVTALLAAYLASLARHTRRREEDARQLRRLNRTYAVLSACNGALVRARDASELCATFCRHLVETGGHRMAFIGVPAGTPERLAWTARERDPRGRAGSVDHAEPPGWPALQAASRGGGPLVVNDLQRAAALAPWRPLAIERGYGAVVVLPLAGGGRGALCIYAPEREPFDAPELRLLEELAGDLAFGLDSLRTSQERDRAAAELRLRERAIESSLDGVVITEVRGDGYPVVYANPAFARITGYTREEVAGRDLGILYGADREQPAIAQLRDATREQREETVLLRSYRKDGSLFWNELHLAPVRTASGTSTHFVAIINDVTDRVRYQQELEHHANHDRLTGLPNRNLLQDRLAQALRLAERHAGLAGVLFLDLDRFKTVNDSLGHDAGDQLLRRMGERLTAVARDSDTVARQGGDEFVAVLPEIRDPGEVAAVAQRMLDAVGEPLELEGEELVMTASIGIAVFPRDGDNVRSLLSNADAAMYRAKRHGRDTFRFYEEHMNARARERLSLERGLRRALERGEFLLHYQPQLDLRTERLAGMEALIRWHDPRRGMVPPGEFIPLAEESDLIVPIGEWVLRSACRQAGAWRAQGLDAVRVAVNVSAQQLRRPDFARLVADALRQSGLPPGHLELELTESTAMDEPERMIAHLAGLKRLGVQIALDDFGTGYSSLAYLKRLPIDRIKIDQSFVRHMIEEPDDAAIAATVIAMAHSMRLHAIAEGVEGAAQLALLRDLHCDEIQGYYLSRPLPAADAARFLRERAGRLRAAAGD